MLASCGKLVRQCRVHRCFDTDSDHFPVLATLKLKLKLKRTVLASNKRFVPNLSLLSDQETSRKFASTASQVLRERVCPSELQSVEDLWTHYKSIQLLVKSLDHACMPRSPGYRRPLSQLSINAEMQCKGVTWKNFGDWQGLGGDH